MQIFLNHPQSRMTRAIRKTFATGRNMLDVFGLKLCIYPPKKGISLLQDVNQQLASGVLK